MIDEMMVRILTTQQCRHRGSEESTKPMYERLEEDRTETDEERGEDTEDMRNDDALAWRHKVFWIMYSIAANVSPTITMFYYAHFFSSEKNESGVSELTKHLFISIFLLVETAISGIPVFYAHVVYPLLFTGSYMAFTVIFWQLEGINHRGKKQIYEGVEYGSTPGEYVALGAFLFASAQLIVHLVLFGVYKLRQFCEKYTK